MGTRPTLLNSCASAATAGEARYRIDSPVPSAEARVIALDEGARAVVNQVAQQFWAGARFFAFDAVVSVDDLAPVANGDGSPPDALVSDLDGHQSRLSDQLAGADVAVMVATSNRAAEAAAVIGQACSQRSIMTAGVILGAGGNTDAAVASMRAHARVMIVSEDAWDVSEVLSALRA